MFYFSSRVAEFRVDRVQFMARQIALFVLNEGILSFLKETVSIFLNDCGILYRAPHIAEAQYAFLISDYERLENNRLCFNGVCKCL